MERRLTSEKSSDNIKMKLKLNLILVTFLVLSLMLVPTLMAFDDTIYVRDYGISYSYSGAQEDETFTLTVTINNTDFAAKEDVVFEFNEDDPFDMDRDDRTWEIGTLESDESTTNTFRIDVDKDTPQGKYDLEFTIEDSEDDFKDELEIEIDSDKADLIIGGIESVPSIISPDQEDIELTIRIDNIGGGDAEFVRASLELSKGFSASNSFSDSVNIGTIKEGEDSEAVFFIDTDEDLESGTQVAKLVLEYRTNSEDEKSTLSFDIPVKGKPLFNVVSSSTSPSKVVQGGTAQINIRIQNIGEEEGKETSVRVFENTDQPFDFEEKTNFVGTLEPQEIGTATFQFDVDKNAVVNSYLVKVQIRTLNKGNVIVSEHTVPVSVQKAENGIFSSKLFIGILVIVILIGGYGIIRVLRKG